MSVVTVRLNGLLSIDKDKTYPVTFQGERVKLKSVISRITVKIPKKAIAFYAINGKKALNDSWVNDGDIIDVFPVVAGG